jgi:hypothetical protein
MCLYVFWLQMGEIAGSEGEGKGGGVCDLPCYYGCDAISGRLLARLIGGITGALWWQMKIL